MNKWVFLIVLFVLWYCNDQYYDTSINCQCFLSPSNQTIPFQELNLDKSECENNCNNEFYCSGIIRLENCEQFYEECIIKCF